MTQRLRLHLPPLCRSDFLFFFSFVLFSAGGNQEGRGMHAHPYPNNSTSQELGPTNLGAEGTQGHIKKDTHPHKA